MICVSTHTITIPRPLLLPAHPLINHAPPPPLSLSCSFHLGQRRVTINGFDFDEDGEETGSNVDGVRVGRLAEGAFEYGFDMGGMTGMAFFVGEPEEVCGRSM